MVKVINHITGRLILKVALIRIKTSVSFETKHSIIKNKIKTSIGKRKPFPDKLILSIVAIEDRRYFSHIGIDFYSIIRATVKNIVATRLEGASTITQQLVRNITNEREISFKRKINEIMFAVLIDNFFTKSEILNAYTDLYIFNSRVGLADLCKNENYDLDNLVHNEFAELAARFKYPHINRTNYTKFLRRVRTIEKNYA